MMYGLLNLTLGTVHGFGYFYSHLLYWQVEKQDYKLAMLGSLQARTIDFMKTSAKKKL